MAVALILVAILLIGCKEEEVISTTTGLLSEATMATAVDENNRPLNPVSVFATDADAFFCSFKVSNAPSDTEIMAEWTYVGGEVEAEVGTNFVIEEQTITVEGTRYAFVVFPRPPFPSYEWPKGDYKVVLYANGKEEASVPFNVQ